MAVDPEKRRHKDEAGTAATENAAYTSRAGLLPRERTVTNIQKTTADIAQKTVTNSAQKAVTNSTQKIVTNSTQKTVTNNSSQKISEVQETTTTNPNSDGSLGEEEQDWEGVPGERAKLTHEKVDIRPTKNIKMKQHLCVKHAMPKTRLTNAILYENVSQGRHLEMKLAGLQHNKHRSLFSMDLNKRAFVAQQDRKRHKWKREDEVRIAGMNLPSFSPEGEMLPRGSTVSGPRRPSVQTIYHMSGADGRADSAEAGRKPLLPMMKIRRERTEIVSHHDKVFVTKLPSVVEVDQQKMNVHNAYCGRALLNRGVPSRDERFRRLHTTLSPAILTGEDEYPLENQTTKSRLSKYVSTSPAVSEPLPHRPEARVMVASRGKSNAQGLDLSVSSAPGCPRTHAIDYVTERKKGGKDIIDMFRSKDIKSLARSLTTDATGMRVGVGAGGGGRGEETDRSVSKPRPHNIFVPVVDVFYKVKTGR